MDARQQFFVQSRHYLFILKWIYYVFLNLALLSLKDDAQFDILRESMCSCFSLFIVNIFFK